MRIPRVFVEVPIAAGVEADLPDAAAHHVNTVLRLRPGAELVLFDGLGGEYPACLLNAHRKGARVRVDAHRDIERESPLDITLVQAISRGERMDYTLQKAVELGVTRIVPVVAERTVVDLRGAGRMERRLEHWQRILIAACEQCGRNRLPGLAEPRELTAWLGRAPPACGLLLALAADTGLPTLPRPVPAITLLAGPEGGFSTPELAAARAAGYRAVSLGPRVLRTETAALAAVAALQSLYGDFAGKA
jgi:16S rRNA (uracil1498-N3)-methyltransferase